MALSENVQPKRLSAKQRKAADLLALDELTDEQIAERVGCASKTLHRWQRLPAFRARIEETAQLAAEAVRQEGITNKANRLQAYREQHEQFEQIRRERAEDALKPDSKLNLYGVPGATTGWIIGSVKLVKHMTQSDRETGEPKVWMEESWEYGVDTGLSREMNNLRKQVAQEMGQWTEKQEIDQTTLIELVGVDPDKL